MSSISSRNRTANVSHVTTGAPPSSQGLGFGAMGPTKPTSVYGTVGLNRLWWARVFLLIVQHVRPLFVMKFFPFESNIMMGHGT